MQLVPAIALLILLAFAMFVPALLHPAVARAAESSVQYSADFEGGAIPVGWLQTEESPLAEMSVVTVPSPVHGGTRSYRHHVWTDGEILLSHTVPMSGYRYEFEGWVYHDTSGPATRTASSLFFLGLSNGDRIGGKFTPQVYGASGGLVTSLFTDVPTRHDISTSGWHRVGLVYDRAAKTVTLSWDGVIVSTMDSASTPALVAAAAPSFFAFGVSEGYGDGTGWWAEDQETMTYFDDVVVRVTMPNVAPVAVADSAVTTQGLACGIDVLANDSDVNSDTLVAAVVSAPAHGDAAWDATRGRIIYTPSPSFIGTDTFGYCASDGTSQSASTTVTVIVKRPNAAPNAVADGPYSATEDQPFSVARPGILANDSDSDGDVLVARLVGAPGHGTVSLSPDGSFSYVPEADYFGSDSFTYVSFDGDAVSAPVKVTLRIAAVNDPPVALDDPGLLTSLTAPTPVDGDRFGDAIAVDATTAVVAASGLDAVFVYEKGPEGVWRTSAKLTAPVAKVGFGKSVAVDNGTIAIGTSYGETVYVYAKCVDGSWTEQSSLMGAGGAGESFGSAVSVSGDTIVVGTGPLSSAVPGSAYVFQRDSGGRWNLVSRIGSPDGVTRGFAAGVAVSGDRLLLTRPNHDAAAGEGAVYAYSRTSGSWRFDQKLSVPGTWWFGSHIALDGVRAVISSSGSTYVYEADGYGQWVRRGALTLTPGCSVLSVAIDGEELAVGGVAESVVPGDRLGDGEVRLFRWRAVGVYDEVGRFSEPNRSHHDVFGKAIAIEDGEIAVASNTYSIESHLGLLETKPRRGIVYFSRTLSLLEDEDITISASMLLGNDWDRDSSVLRVVASASPLHGTATVSSDGAILYRPSADFNGYDSLTYRISDGSAVSAAAKIRVEVLPVNDAPVAVSDEITVTAGKREQIDVLENDKDVDGQSLLATIQSYPSHGVIAWDSSSSCYIYRSLPGYRGEDSFTYSATDGAERSGVASVRLHVLAGAANPGGGPNGTVTTTEGAGVEIGLGAGESSSVEASRVSVTIPPSNGIVTWDALEQVFRYVPVSGFYGTDTFAYVISSDSTSPAQELVTVTVSESKSPFAFSDPSLFTARTVGVSKSLRRAIALDLAANDNFGKAVAVSGNIALVGVPGDDPKGLDSGAAYVYERNRTTWSRTAKIVARDGQAGDNFGCSISIDGTTALIGARKEDDRAKDAGAVYVFSRESTGVWTFVDKLTASDASAGDDFGASVSLSAGRALIGAPGAEGSANTTDAGAAYVFTRQQQHWSQVATLVASDAAANDRLGKSVALSFDTAAVGAPGDDDKATNAGSVRIYQLFLGTWNQQANLKASDGAAGDAFGSSVSLERNRCVVGAPLDDDKGKDSGSVYVYERASGTWAKTAKLRAADGAAGDKFGTSASLARDRLLIGAPLDNIGTSTDAGSAYAFQRYGARWLQVTKLTAPARRSNDRFGQALGLGRDCAAVGAYLNDAGAKNAGAVYFPETQFLVRKGTPLVVAAPGVLTNDASVDEQGRSVRVVSPSLHGTVTLLPTGGFTYRPVAGYIGRDSFTYEVSGPSGNSEPVIVSLLVK